MTKDRLLSFFFLLTAITFPLGHLLDLQFFGTKVFPNVLDLLLPILFLLSFQKRFLNNSIFKRFLLLNLALLVSLIFNFTPLSFPIGIMYLLRFFFSSSIFLAIQTLSNKNLTKILFFSSLTLLALGFLQYIFLPDTRFLKFLGFDDHLYRFIGTLYDPNYMGAILGALVILYFDFFPKKLYFLAPLIALGLTFSRASYLSFFVAIIIYGYFKSRRLILLSLLLVALSILIAPKPFGEGVNLLRTYSIQSRLNTQTQALSLFLQKPIFGYGIGILKSLIPVSENVLTDRASRIDNSILYTLVSGGLLSLVFLKLFLYKVIQTVKASPVTLSTIVLVLIHSLTNNSFYYLWISVFFWVILGLHLRRKVSSN